MRAAAAIALAVCTSVYGCAFDLDLEEKLWTCTAATDCPAHNICVGGVCRSEFLPDAGGSTGMDIPAPSDADDVIKDAPPPKDPGPDPGDLGDSTDLPDSPPPDTPDVPEDIPEDVPDLADPCDTDPAPPHTLATAPTSPSQQLEGVVLTGVGPPCATITVHEGGGCTGEVLGLGDADDAGAFSVEVKVKAQTTTTLSASAQVGDDPPQCSAETVDYEHDEVAPAAPELLSVTPAGPTKVVKPTLTLSAEQWSTVSVFLGAGCAPENLVGSGVVTGAQVLIDATVSPNELVTFSATAQDPAGNVSECAEPATQYLADTLPPVFGGKPIAVAQSESTIAVTLPTATDNQPGEIAVGVCAKSVADACLDKFESNATADGDTYSDDALTPGQARFYVLQATDAAGNTALSAQVGAKSMSEQTVISVAVGSEHTCALTGQGTVWCWGKTDSGECGVVPAEGSVGTTPPTPVDDIEDVIAVTAGKLHTCALRIDGSVLCWGSNGAGQLSADPNGALKVTGTPQEITSVDSAVGVGAGFQHTCATLADGAVACWGRNKELQLGANPTPAWAVVEATSVAPVVHLGVGKNHNCVVHGNGTTSCWGSNSAAQLSVSTATKPKSLEPVGVVTDVFDTPLTGVIAVTGGEKHNCALRANGSAHCWGSNIENQLGEKDKPGGINPLGVTVDGFSGGLTIAAGGQVSCAAFADGAGTCWGNPELGENGLGVDEAQGFVDVLWAVPTDIVAVATAKHTCAVTSGGETWCWGGNAFGQATGSPSSEKFVPLPISGPVAVAGATAVSAGHAHTCGLIADGQVRCWGLGAEGQLGQGDASSATAIDAIGMGSVRALSAGGAHTCTLGGDGLVRCVGANTTGQLGSGTTDPEASPQIAVGVGAAIAVAAGATHTCAIDQDGAVWCWGQNDDGQLGVTASEPKPVPLLNGVAGASALASGFGHTCALQATGAAKCWGRNTDEQLGDAGGSGPITVSLSGSPLKALATGEGHTCALTHIGEVVCWGRSADGQTGVKSAQPLPPDSLAGPSLTARGIAAGADHTCAIRHNGTVSCWGVGFGATPGAVEDIPVLSPSKAIAAGDGTTCSLSGAGAITCLGENDEGQLGYGKYGSDGDPVLNIP